MLPLQRFRSRNKCSTAGSDPWGDKKITRAVHAGGPYLKKSSQFVSWLVLSSGAKFNLSDCL